MSTHNPFNVLVEGLGNPKAIPRPICIELASDRMRALERHVDAWGTGHAPKPKPFASIHGVPLVEDRGLGDGVGLVHYSDGTVGLI